ncbi:MAG: hypothetical protein H6825_05805 [Planctomycetes bacterium]|nr:hypothetical protein [Planctomycetota bacterium]
MSEVETEPPLPERRARFGLLWLALAGALWLLVWPGLARLSGPADLGPVMPEMDGVHPARALEALRTAYSPGAGFLDKYPPLGSFVMGVTCALVDPGLPDFGTLEPLDPNARRQMLWEHGDTTLELLRAERWVSRVAMALAVALTMVLAARLARRVTRHTLLADRLAPALVLLTFGATYPVAYYGATTNVDALMLCAAVGALLAAVERRWTEAALAAAIATAFKDPAFVLGPVVVLGALFDGRRGGPKVALRCALLGLGAYAFLGGALLTPQTFLDHVRYLVTGGVEHVPRIDSSDPTQWAGLLTYSGRLLLDAAGGAPCLLALLGLGLVAARDRLAAALLPGVVVSTLLLFVVPAGFCYVRFLLVPLALVGALTAVAGVACVEVALRRRDLGPKQGLVGIVVLLALVSLADWGWGELTRTVGWGRAPLAPLEELHTLLVERDDPRAEAALALATLLPDGGRVTLVADGREAGPPVSPLAYDYAVYGIADAPGLDARWRARPETRPDALLWMTFPTELPTGRDSAATPPLAVGQEVAGMRVAAVFGSPRGTVVERTLAVRPTVSLLVRP